MFMCGLIVGLIVNLNDIAKKSKMHYIVFMSSVYLLLINACKK